MDAGIALGAAASDKGSGMSILLARIAARRRSAPLTIYDYLHAWWDFDEAGGSTAYETSYLSGTGSASGGTPPDGGRSFSLGAGITWGTSPKVGQSCLRNAARSTYAATTANSMLDFTNQSFYMAAHVRADADAQSASLWCGILSRYNPTNGQRQYALRLLPGYQLSFYMRDNSSSAGTTIEALTPTGALVNGVFAFVELVFDWAAQVAEIWVNRTKVATTALTGLPLQSAGGSAPFRLFNTGTPTTGQSFVGNIDQLCVIGDYIPTPTERDTIYNSGAGVSFREFQEAFGADGNYGPGATTWFNDPRAITVAGIPVVGSATRDGSPSLSQISTSGGAATTLRLRPAYQIDDHTNPAFLQRASDGKVLAFYCAHQGVIRMRVSANANDVSAFDAEIDINSQIGTSTQKSYCNPFELTGESGSPIYLFFRSGSAPTRPTRMSKSLDGGVTWSAETIIIENGSQRPYVKYVQNGSDRIDFLCTDGHPAEAANNSIYHAYYQGGSYYKTDGTAIGHAPPFTPASDFTRIFDGSTADGVAWVWDIQIDATGNPVAVFARFPSTDDHHYMYATVDSGAWSVHEICSAGGPLYADQAYYSGGVSIDPDDTSTVYASRSISGGTYQLWKYSTTDDGVTWASNKLTNGTYPSFRPYVIRGSRILSYVNGRYDSYTEFYDQVRTLSL